MLTTIAGRVFSFRDEFADEPKPFLCHLDDLRSTIIRMGVVLVAAMVLSFCFRGQLFAVVQHPLLAVDAAALSNLQSLGVTDSFSISLELSFYAGLVLAFPPLLYFLADFVLPALRNNERRHLWPAAGIGFGLFLVGVAFAYFVVLPRALGFFYHDATSLGWRPTWTVREYCSFTTQLVIAFGLAFELPVVVLLLIKFGVLNPAMLRRVRAQAFVAVMILASVLAPTPDIMTMLMMALPMYFLYEACIVISAMMERGQLRADLAFEAKPERLLTKKSR